MDDLTGRARVRNAALLEFADRGWAGASVRSVAARAGVSPGLVQHHFATKASLWQACDDYVVEYLGDVVRGQGPAPQRLSALEVERGPVARYLARALSEGSSGASAVFDGIVATTQVSLAAAPPAVPVSRFASPRDLAVVLTALRFAPLVLGRHIARGLGINDLDDGDRAALVVSIMESMLRPELSSARLFNGASAVETDEDNERERQGDRA